VRKMNFTGESSKMLTPTIVKTIFKSDYFSNLQELDLSFTKLDDKAFDFLKEEGLKLMSSLTVLRLSKNISIQMGSS
jgi:Leucine-rich repeat (LRR) protein